jgi:hypothetical protein
MFMLAALMFQPNNMSVLPGIAYESTFRSDQDLEFGISVGFEVMCGMLIC